jgi:hypothetical protein
MVIGAFIFHLYFYRFDPSGVSLMLSSFSPIIFFRAVLPILKLLKIFMEEIRLTLAFAETNLKQK